MQKLFTYIVVFTATLFLTTSALACTDFRMTASDGTVVIARSMEFAVDLKSNLMTSSRGRTISNVTPNGKPGLAWKTKYGYAFLDSLGMGVTVDGMNEAGLSIEALYLPGDTQYQTIPAGQEKHALPYFNFGDWVLGNFKTVDEVQKALSTIYVYATTIPQVKDMIFPLHFAIYDNTGKGIVVEFVSGNLQVSENKVGVLTNSPTYNWHVTNLRNYLNLSPTNPNPVIANGMTFVSTGQGSGMIGLPGDISRHLVSLK